MSKILFVCEGNVCRSPFAERILKKSLELKGSTDLDIASAGLNARVGEAMDETTAAITKEFDVDPYGHRANQVTVLQIGSADLILTATRGQRSAVVKLSPAAVKHTMTVRQLGRILHAAEKEDLLPSPETATSDALRATISYATQHRGRQFTKKREEDDVVDPFRRSSKVHQLAVDQLLPAVNLLGLALGGSAVQRTARTQAKR